MISRLLTPCLPHTEAVLFPPLDPDCLKCHLRAQERWQPCWWPLSNENVVPFQTLINMGTKQMRHQSHAHWTQSQILLQILQHLHHSFNAQTPSGQLAEHILTYILSSYVLGIFSVLWLWLSLLYICHLAVRPGRGVPPLLWSFLPNQKFLFEGGFSPFEMSVLYTLQIVNPPEALWFVTI